MNKKISLVTLGLSLSSIVILTGAMIISQPKYTLKNIVGKQSSLGDVVVYSQSKRGIYSNDSVILSKDKYQFNKNVNQNPDLYKYSKNFNKNRDIFPGYIHDTGSIYSDENSIGYIEYIDEQYGETDITLSTTIKDKNLNTGEVSEFEIKIPNSLKPEYNYGRKELVTKYKDEVYIVLLEEQESNPDRKKTRKDELEDFVEISKVDFNNKEAKSVNKINLKVDDKSKYRLVYNNPFVIDNRVYFYLENQDTLENNYYLAYYDMENNKFDYIHFHLMEFSCFEIILLAKKYSDSNIILHSHIANDNKRSLKTNILNKIGEILVSKKDNYIKVACSKDAGYFMFKNFKNKEFVVLNNAIDLKNFAYNEEIRERVRAKFGLENKLVIGHVGRFVKQKNHIRLIDIFYNIYKQNKNSVLVLIGKGPLLDVIKQKVNELGIENAVIFGGIRDDINEIYQAMDIFLFPSLFEGLPFVLVEAQTAGLPCFITDNLSDEVRVLDTTIPISLDEDNSFWSRKILSYLKQISNKKRKEKSKEMYKSKFNIEEEIKFIEKIYIDNVSIIGCDI